MEHSLGLVGAAEGEAAGEVVLRVHLQLNGHGSCDAAHVSVALHTAAAVAADDLARPGGGDVLLGGVLDPIVEAVLCVAPQLNGGEKHVKDHMALAIYRPQVGGEGVVPVLDGTVQALHLVEEAAHGGVEAVAGGSEVLPQGGELHRSVLGEAVHCVAGGVKSAVDQPPYGGGGGGSALQFPQRVLQLARETVGTVQGLLDGGDGGLQALARLRELFKEFIQFAVLNVRKGDIRRDGNVLHRAGDIIKGLLRVHQGGEELVLLRKVLRLTEGVLYVPGSVGGVREGAAQALQGALDLSGGLFGGLGVIGDRAQNQRFCGGREGVGRSGEAVPCLLEAT